MEWSARAARRWKTRGELEEETGRGRLERSGGPREAQVRKQASESLGAQGDEAERGEKSERSEFSLEAPARSLAGTPANGDEKRQRSVRGPRSVVSRLRDSVAACRAGAVGGISRERRVRYRRCAPTHLSGITRSTGESERVAPVRDDAENDVSSDLGRGSRQNGRALRKRERENILWTRTRGFFPRR